MVVGCVPKPLPPMPRAVLKPRRESGVDGGLEEKGTVNPPGIVRLGSARWCEIKNRHYSKEVLGGIVAVAPAIDTAILLLTKDRSRAAVVSTSQQF